MTGIRLQSPDLFSAPVPSMGEDEEGDQTGPWNSRLQGGCQFTGTVTLFLDPLSFVLLSLYSQGPESPGLGRHSPFPLCNVEKACEARKPRLLEDYDLLLRREALKRGWGRKFSNRAPCDRSNALWL